MQSFFPRTTIELTQPGAFRRFSFSLVEMAVITGLLVRLYRLFVVTHSSSWAYVLGMAVGMLFLLAMTTLHLANYPLHQYLWRAPVFALVEVVAEMAASALLIWLGREPNGSVRAHWDDWVGMGLNTLLWRGLIIVLWGLALAGIVQIVRRTIVAEDEIEPTPEGVSS